MFNAILTITQSLTLHKPAIQIMSVKNPGIMGATISRKIAKSFKMSAMNLQVLAIKKERIFI